MVPCENEIDIFLIKGEWIIKNHFDLLQTDDQILLLQNCWSDLLALGVCWRSVSNSSILNLSDERSVTIEEAAAYGFGDVANRLHSITQSLQSLHMDQYEYVALKVLLLITPGSWYVYIFRCISSNHVPCDKIWYIYLYGVFFMIHLILFFLCHGVLSFNGRLSLKYYITFELRQKSSSLL